jgi:hypothetical protein
MTAPACAAPKSAAASAGRGPAGLAPAALAVLAAMALAAGCAPTVHVKVDPITIYAKLDANVRLSLDQDVKDLIQKNPNLF